ncbi:MAG: AAA family ATPase [Rhizobiales bacterium]|nr:AAA family ATPase [Hyphomicrobiales bacterium]NRB14266.1 AAA family ATPase [Hyphomicrobiales bacterium]
MSEKDFFDALPDDMDISQTDVQQSAPIIRQNVDIMATDTPAVPLQQNQAVEPPSIEAQLAQAAPHIPVAQNPLTAQQEILNQGEMPTEYASEATQPAQAAMASMETEASHKVMQIPQISIQAFYETNVAAQLLQTSAADRRMSRTHITMQAGGIVAAANFYQNIPTPNLIVIESRLGQQELLNALDQLAEVCDAGTKVLVIGHQNDIRLYRELVSKGISDYLVLPTEPLNFIESIFDIYNDPATEPLGKKYAFYGAKGGVGSSTLAHNLAYTIASEIKDSVTAIDMDFSFGTLGLNFNQDPMQDITDLLKTPDRIDDATIDKMVIKYSGHLNLLPNISSIEKTETIGVEAVQTLLDCVSKNVANSVIDLPHIWNEWTKACLIGADQIIITAMPDLASLRNTKNIVDYLKSNRSQDIDPIIIMNQVGMVKKPEIKTRDFADTIGIPILTEIAYDPRLFGTAANNGQMLHEFTKTDSVLAQLSELAEQIVGKKTQQISGKKSLLDMFKLKRSA